ncbi:MAG: hypothetical protein GX997_08010 [Bacteroidales bacterium]|nr:hypothetical protein [Bacteroidales bacterium]
MNNIKIAFVGDIMPGGVLHGISSGYISNRLLTYLNNFDLRIGTLERAIGDNFDFDKRKMKGKKSIIYSKNIDIEKLVLLNIDAVSLANNHVFDLGKDGLYNTFTSERD